VSRRRPTIKFVGFVARSYLVVYEFTGVDYEQFTERRQARVILPPIKSTAEASQMLLRR